MIRDAYLAPAGLDSSDHLGPVSASPQVWLEQRQQDSERRS